MQTRQLQLRLKHFYPKLMAILLSLRLIVVVCLTQLVKIDPQEFNLTLRGVESQIRGDIERLDSVQ